MSQAAIHTTVNLPQSLAATLDAHAAYIGVKRSQLVVLLLRKFLASWKNMKRAMMSVEYQKNELGEGWKKLHVFFEAVDYEVFTDMRNCFKRSVSALLSMAIRRYICGRVTDGKKDFWGDCDNYHINGYRCDGKLDRTGICWHIIWEMDEKTAQKLKG